MGAMTVVCNAGGMPLGMVDMQRAVGELARQFIDGTKHTYALVSDEERHFRSTSGVSIPAPLVIATRYPGGWADVSADNRRPTRRVLFARDHYTCQYCGFVAAASDAHRTLTVDHVRPAHMYPSRGAATTWENCVTSCAPCNRRKGGHLPREVHGFDGRPMLPRTTPRKPDFVQLRFSWRLHPAQRDYVEQFRRDRKGVSI